MPWHEKKLDRVTLIHLVHYEDSDYKKQDNEIKIAFLNSLLSVS